MHQEMERCEIVWRSASMKLLIGLVAYLSVVTAVVAAVLLGVSSLEYHQSPEQPVLAKGVDSGTDGRAAGAERAREEAIRDDPNRVPVWIVPTAKYEYTPVPVDPSPKRTQVIGGSAARAMAREHRRRTVAHDEPERAGPSLSAAPKRRDNDPFFRD